MIKIIISFMQSTQFKTFFEKNVVYKKNLLKNKKAWTD